MADMTDPDWEADHERQRRSHHRAGGRHAAIIARELGIPAVVGTGSATRELSDGRPVTVSCAEGDTGFVYDGILDFTVESTELETMPEIPVKIMMNVGTPDQAFAFSRLPNAGVGLARLEFIINRQIGIHPKALLDLDTLEGPLQAQIAEQVPLSEPPGLLCHPGRRGCHVAAASHRTVIVRVGFNQCLRQPDRLGAVAALRYPCRLPGAPLLSPGFRRCSPWSARRCPMSRPMGRPRQDHIPVVRPRRGRR